MTAQPQHRVEASCLLPMGVQSRLMGSKKALRKRENCSNSNPMASWSHEEACLGPGKSTLDSMQMESAPLWVVQRSARDRLGGDEVRALGRGWRQAPG